MDGGNFVVLTLLLQGKMPVGSRSKLRPACRPKIVKKKTNKFVRFEADLFKRMNVRTMPGLPILQDTTFDEPAVVTTACATCDGNRAIFPRGLLSSGEI
eukprot:3020517-Rhodomonas_salina.3